MNLKDVSTIFIPGPEIPYPPSGVVSFNKCAAAYHSIRWDCWQNKQQFGWTTVGKSTLIGVGKNVAAFYQFMTAANSNY